MQRYAVAPPERPTADQRYALARVRECRLFFRPLAYENLPPGTRILIDDWVSVNYGEASVPIDPAAGGILEVQFPNVTFTVANVNNSPNDPVTVCH
jgi:hypothetical protein